MPTIEHVDIDLTSRPSWKPSCHFPGRASGLQCRPRGACASVKVGGNHRLINHGLSTKGGYFPNSHNMT